MITYKFTLFAWIVIACFCVCLAVKAGVELSHRVRHDIVSIECLDKGTPFGSRGQQRCVWWL